MHYGSLMMAFQLASSMAFKLAATPDEKTVPDVEKTEPESVVAAKDVPGAEKSLVTVLVDVRSDTRNKFLDFEHVQLYSSWKAMYSTWLCHVKECCQQCQDSQAQVDEALFKVVLRVFEEECDMCNYGKKIEPTDDDLAENPDYKIDDDDYTKRSTKCVREVRRSDALTFPAIINALYKSIKNSYRDLGRGNEFPPTYVNAVWEIRNNRRDCAKTGDPHTCGETHPLDVIVGHLKPTAKRSKEFRECEFTKENKKDENGVDVEKWMCSSKKSDQSCKPAERKMATVAAFCKAAMGYYCAHRVADFGSKD